MKRRRTISSPARLGGLLLAAAGCTVPRVAIREAPRLTFETESLRVELDPQTLDWRVEDPRAPSQTVPLLASRLAVETDPAGLTRSEGRLTGPADGTPCETPLGPARFWTAVLADPDSRLELEWGVTILQRRRALLLSATFHNASTQTAMVDGITLLDAPATRLSAPLPADRIRVLVQPLTTRGLPQLWPASQDPIPASHAVTLAVAPEGPWSILAGFPTSRSGSGRLTWASEPVTGDRGLRLGASWRGIVSRLGPDERLAADKLLIVWDPDPHAAMDAFVASTRRPEPAREMSSPAGWSTAPACRADVSEGSLLRNLRAAERHLKAAGLDLILIDEGYHRSEGDWETHARLPRGHRWITGQIHEHGFRAGLAIAPLDISEQSPLFASHPAWLRRVPGTARHARLDVSRPDARRWLADLAQLIVHEWGYDAIQADRLITSAPPFARDAAPPPEEERRRVLELFREALGPDRLLLASDLTPAAACGVADAVRVGPDTGPGWEAVRDAALALAFAQPFHRSAWRAVPKALSLAPPLTGDEAATWAGILAVTGGMLLLGDDLTLLPPERLALYQKLLPSLPALGKAVDLFDQAPIQSSIPPPAVWHRPVRLDGEESSLVLLVNWAEAPARIAIPMSRLGIPENGPPVVCNLTAGAMLEPVSGRIEADLRPHASCRLMICPRRDRPQVVGTSRHLIPGVVDLSQVGWDPAHCELSGRSRHLIPAAARVPGSTEPDYSLLIHVPEGFRLDRAGASVPCLAARVGPGLIRLEFPVVTTDAVDWSIRFAAGARKPASGSAP